MTDAAPVTQALERKLASDLRKKGILVWLDKHTQYRSFVAGLAERAAAGTFPHPVVAFQGSFVELLLLLEPYGSGLDRAPLLIHMPGFNEETIRATPVLELYDAGQRFQQALDTLVREAAVGRVAPAEVEAFLATRPTLEQADQWLVSASSGHARDVLAYLEDVGPHLLVDALGGDDAVLTARARTAESRAALRQYLHQLTGLDDAWLDQFAPHAERSDASLDDAKRVRQLLDAAGAWLLAVEYVHDLRRPPHLPALARLGALAAPLVKACRHALDQLRARYPDAYARRADDAESFIADELSLMSAHDLGHIDTFREEENRVLEGAVAALARGEWAQAVEWCQAREGDRSFWLRRDETRRRAWGLVAEAAAFGAVLAAHPRPLARTRSVDEAVAAYASAAYRVDHAHRQFEQRRQSQLDARVPHFGALQEVVGVLRARHRAWADQLTRDFSALCRDGSFLPSDDLQQRTLFDQLVLPLTASGEKVAVFVVDALRYEMGAQLADELRASGTPVDLKARLAELPTITSVGMNALAPVAKNGRLHVAGALRGFRTGEFIVDGPESRARAMGLRAVGQAGLRLSLDDACSTPTAALKRRVAPHRLVLVQSTELDDAGEANVGLSAFEETLHQIAAAWRHLQLAGVKHFLFTADHGFLLQDDTTQLRDYGKKIDPSRRHVLAEHPRQEAGMLPVSLASLGYDGVDGYLLLLDDTAQFTTGNAGSNFAHGGNSLQERVIPVLTVTRPRPEGRSAAEYVIEAEPRTDVAGSHRLNMRVMFAPDTTGGLGFAARSHITVAIRAPDRGDVTPVLRDVEGEGKLKGGRVTLPVGAAWTVLYFALEGPRDERVRVEIHHPDLAESVRPVTVDAWFTVSGRAAPVSAAAPVADVQRGPVAPPAAHAAVERALLSWADAIEHEGFRRVLLHIDTHGAITEPEVTKLLGSARALRRFSLEIDGLIDKLPFRVRVEPGEGGKRYVKEGAK